MSTHVGVAPPAWQHLALAHAPAEGARTATPGGCIGSAAASARWMALLHGYPSPASPKPMRAKAVGNRRHYRRRCRLHHGCRTDRWEQLQQQHLPQRGSRSSSSYRRRLTAASGTLQRQSSAEVLRRMLRRMLGVRQAVWVCKQSRRMPRHMLRRKRRCRAKSGLKGISEDVVG